MSVPSLRATGAENLANRLTHTPDTEKKTDGTERPTVPMCACCYQTEDFPTPGFPPEFLQQSQHGAAPGAETEGEAPRPRRKSQAVTTRRDMSGGSRVRDLSMGSQVRERSTGSQVRDASMGSRVRDLSTGSRVSGV